MTMLVWNAEAVAADGLGGERFFLAQPFTENTR